MEGWYLLIAKKFTASANLSEHWALRLSQLMLSFVKFMASDGDILLIDMKNMAPHMAFSALKRIVGLLFPRCAPI